MVRPTLLAVLFTISGCSEDPPGNSGPNVNSHVETFDLPGYKYGELDVLFVVDNTTGMAPYQTQLAELAAGVDMATSENFDVRLAVTTTDASAGGALRSPANTVDPFVENGISPHFERVKNYTGTLADALGPALAVGATGSASVQPLEAMKLALDSHPAFVRDRSLLVAMTIAASDDASGASPTTYADALKARRSDPATIAVVGDYAMPATRLAAFHTQFPNRNWSDDLATTTPLESFMGLTTLYRNVLGAPCTRVPLDVDPETPGPQYDCDVTAYYSDDTAETLRPCDGGPARCYEFIPSPSVCTLPGTAELRLRGYVGGLPRVTGQCVVESL